MTGMAQILLAGGPPGQINDSLPNEGAVDGRATWGIDSDGTFSVSGGSGNWVTPVSVAAQYEIKVDPTTNTFDGGDSTGVWLACTSNRSWWVNDPGGTNTKTVTFTVSFRPSGGATQSTQTGVQCQSVSTA